MKANRAAGCLFLGALLPCRALAGEDLPPAWPAATLSNAHLRLTVYRPVPGAGYYQAARFDWSSLLGDIDVAGHRYFVVHHPGPHNPHGHDNVDGPAEEFDLETPPPGFAEAAPGGLFLKIGVGVLRRPDEKDYFFARDYEIVDHGRWEFAAAGATSVVCRHAAALPGGRLGYVLERRLAPAQDGLRLVIRRTLRNTGTIPLRSRHYAHNFVRIDGHPIGRDYRLELPFAPRPVAPATLPAAARLEGRMLAFLPEVLEETFWTSLGGFAATPEHNRVTVRHVPDGAAVSFATDLPLADFRVYATSRVLCPEPFVDLALAPGEEIAWNTVIGFEPPFPPAVVP